MTQRIVLDGLPLQVRSAGVGVYVDALVRALASLRRDTEFVLFGLSRTLHAALHLTAGGHRSDAAWPANVCVTASTLYPLVMGYPIVGSPRLLPLETAVSGAHLFHATNYLCPRTHRIPLVVSVHDLALLRHPDLGTAALRGIVRRVHRSVREASRVIAVSEWTRRDVIDLLGVPPHKLRVVHLGCDSRFQPLDRAFARLRVQERLGLRTAYILHVGTLEPRKNIETLIRAYARLWREHQITHHLVLAGDRGWKYEPVLHLVDTLGLQDAVRFTGAVPADDLPALYNAADLVVYPSLYEGFGLPPLEAMACGTPVVTSNVSSLPEVVGDAGLLVDPRDPEGLAEAMLRALTEGDLRAELRARGLDRARRFSWERCARETLAVYAEAIGSA